MALLPSYTLSLEVSSIKLCPGLLASDRAFSKSLCTRGLALWKPKALAAGRSISQTTPIKVQQCEALTARTTEIHSLLKMQTMTSLRPHSYLHSHFFCPGGSSFRMSSVPYGSRQLGVWSSLGLNSKNSTQVAKGRCSTLETQQTLTLETLQSSWTTEA